MTLREEDPIGAAIRRVVFNNIADLRLTSDGQDAVSERVAGMIEDAQDLFSARTDDAAVEEFEAALSELDLRIAAEVNRLVTASDERFPQVDAEQVRRSMGVICPTRPFCTGA